MQIKRMPTPLLIFALWALPFVDGMRTHQLGLNSMADSSRGQRDDRLQRSTEDEKSTERQLLPHPHHSNHQQQSSNHYLGCFGLSKEEREQAWGFQGQMAPCTIEVDGDVVVDGDGSSSGGSSSGGSSSSGSGGGSSSSSSGSNGDNTSGSESSSGNENQDGASDGKDGRDAYGDDDDGIDKGDNDDDGNAYDLYPLQYFNISDCGTYSHLWMWDLALTCDENSTSFEGCSCTSAEMLYQYGELECPSTFSDSPSCPKNCAVCNTCMKMLGCLEKDLQGGHGRLPKEFEDGLSEMLPIVLIILSIAVATCICCVSMYRLKKSRDIEKEGRLRAALSLSLLR